MNYIHRLKLHICKKVSFDQLLDFQISFLLSVCHILLFGCWICSIPSGVKQFRSRSGPTFCRAWSGSELFEKVISRQQKSTLAGKELNTKQLVDTTFWLKTWLKLISFGSNFFYLAKVLLHQILSQAKPWICTKCCACEQQMLWLYCGNVHVFLGTKNLMNWHI